MAVRNAGARCNPTEKSFLGATDVRSAVSHPREAAGAAAGGAEWSGAMRARSAIQLNIVLRATDVRSAVSHPREAAGAAAQCEGALQLS